MNTLVPRWTSADDITPEDLTAALRDGGVLGDDASVATVSSESIGVGVGIVALLWRLDVTYEPAHAGPRSIIVKLPQSSPIMRGTAAALRFYEREVGFYAKVAPTTPIGTPRCYWSTFDPSTADFVLLLEDIGALDCHDQLVGIPIEDVRVAVAALAAHHAACWERDDILGASWTGVMTEPPLPQAMAQLIDAQLPVFADRLGGRLPSGTVQIAERIRDQLDVFVEPLTRGPLTLVHGDFRADNLFFAPGPARELVAIDWQIAVLGRAAYDVGYLMAQSVTTEVRKAHEANIVRDYHAVLGRADYTLEDCWDDYRRTILWSLVYSVGVMSEDQTDPRAIELALTMGTRSARAIADLDATELFVR
jgi:hypothetical protein